MSRGEDESVDTLSAAAVHWMQQISGQVPVVRAGRIVNEEPLRSIALELPGGRRGNAYVVGHPEPGDVSSDHQSCGASRQI